ncbi:hypothetical protein [Candidatus Amarobacter glycogenicus]|uniref:hypothetical protein n=1 Tax=Candidatus Amarobacter glycogenicus TaxID=3140699 RepID=UPI002A0E1E3D|nr:hypothetical protein [Dehalococcoidia bacterium]
MLLLFPVIVEQGTTIAAAVPGYYQSLREWMVHYPNQLIVRLSEFFPATLPSLAPTQQTNGTANAGFGRASVRLCGIGGQSHFYRHRHSAVGLHWTLVGANHSVLVAAGSKGPTQEH